jgi:hypothetical protein
VKDIIDILEDLVNERGWSEEQEIAARVTLFFAAALEPHRAEELIGHTAFWSQIKSAGMLDWISNEMLGDMIMQRMIGSLRRPTKEVQRFRGTLR